MMNCNNMKRNILITVLTVWALMMTCTTSLLVGIINDVFGHQYKYLEKIYYLETSNETYRYQYMLINAQHKALNYADSMIITNNLSDKERSNFIEKYRSVMVKVDSLRKLDFNQKVKR